MKRIVSIVALATAISLTTPALSQCAMCRMNAESATENVDEGIGRGLNNGIMYLMGIPYLLLGVGAYTFFRKRSRNSAEA